MKLFISWSGEPSRTIAKTLNDWIPSVLQTVDTWMSADAIDAGTRWSAVIASELKETKFGIICLTRNNQNAPWLMFEAGAVAKTIDDTHVVPYLIGLEPAEIAAGHPLTQFQAKRANETQTLELLRTINRTSEKPLSDDKLSRSFELWWPDLNKALDTMPVDDAAAKPSRTEGDMVAEILELVRDFTRRSKELASDPTASQTHFTPDNYVGGTGKVFVVSSQGQLVLDRAMNDPMLLQMLTNTSPEERSRQVHFYVKSAIPALRLGELGAIRLILYAFFEREHGLKFESNLNQDLPDNLALVEEHEQLHKSNPPNSHSGEPNGSEGANIHH
jgi:hypothetical protein